MGRFTYDSSIKADFDDRLLAHLQVVIAAKVRRGEGFHFTWKDDPSIGGGRTMVWVHPHVSLVYKFHGSRQPTINRAWIEAMMHAANTTAGLYPISEPAAEATSSDDAMRQRAFQDSR